MLRGVNGSGGGAPVGGSGTSSPSTIPRWTGASTLGDSGLIDDGTQVYTTTRNLAIGAATAWAKLVAQGASDAGPTSTVKGIAGVFTSTNVALSFGGYTAAPYGMWIQAHDYRSGVSAQYPIVLQPAGGNVGIGTASPLAQFTLGGAANATYKMGFQSAAGPTEVASISMNSATGEQRITSGFAAWGGFQTFYTNGSERARIDSNGNIYGTSGTTGMTNGFFYIPAAAGAPTGAPTAVSGRVPMYYDTTNNQFYVYNGAWKKVTLA